MPAIKPLRPPLATPQLLQIKTREQEHRSVKLHVKFPQEDYRALQSIQDEMDRDPLTPAASIHALVLKAVRNYIQDFQNRKKR